MRKFSFSLIILVYLLGSLAEAKGVDLGDPSTTMAFDDQQWQELTNKMYGWARAERVEGISYIVSGSLVTLGAAAGFHSTKDPFGKLVFSLAQGLGLGALGEGLYKVQVGHEIFDVHDALEASSSLTPAQRAEVFYVYHQRWRRRSEQQERIQAIIYGLTGVAYAYNAHHTEAGAAKDLLYGLSALSFILSARLAF